MGGVIFMPSPQKKRFYNMKSGARIQSCIEVLEKIEKASIPMDNIIRDYMHYRRYIGSKDRAAIVEHVYAVMRSYGRICWWIRKGNMDLLPRMMVLTHMSFMGDHISALFSGEKHCPDPLSDEEQGYIEFLSGQDFNHVDMPDDVRNECPEWACAALQKLYHNNFSDHLQAMLQPATLDLRVNTLKSDREAAKALLEQQDVQTEMTEFSPAGLRVIGKAYMSVTKAFSKGFVEIQDEGSQLISYMCGVKPGMRVLDFCAGAGGKTLGIAAMMENKGNIVAMDIDKRRLEKGRKRYSKAGVHNVELRCLEEDKSRKWLRRQKGTMDAVLVDAPCSSSGTWRRNPDLRWNFYGPSLEEIKTMQEEILERVADKVKIGGRLVYATCSLFEEENEEQIDKFLNSHKNYRYVTKQELPPFLPVNKDNNLRLSPKDHKTDGFFACSLIREE